MGFDQVLSKLLPGIAEMIERVDSVLPGTLRRAEKKVPRGNDNPPLAAFVIGDRAFPTFDGWFAIDELAAV